MSLVAASSSKAIGYSPARSRAGGGAVRHRSLHRDLLGVAVIASMKATVEGARRWTAAGIFRLASLILRVAMKLHHQRRISHNGLRTVLSGARWLERLGGWLALGNRRRRQPTKRD